MESGAKGCEVVVSGKLRGQRAKAMKFVDGLMIHSGDPCNDYVDAACRHVLLRQVSKIWIMSGPHKRFSKLFCPYVIKPCTSRLKIRRWFSDVVTIEKIKLFSLWL